jgi:hypothetical protein
MCMYMCLTTTTSGWRRPMAQLTKKGRLMLCVPVDGHTDNGVTNGRARDVEQPVPGIRRQYCSGAIQICT